FFIDRQKSFSYRCFLANKDPINSINCYDTANQDILGSESQKKFTLFVIFRLERLFNEDKT
ncbi:MAG: hypothetical protein ABRQ29_04490, partial [Smithellaceae bacterium]